MRRLFLAACFLVLTISTSHGDKAFTSLEFKFIAVFPAEVHTTSGDHGDGKVATFQAVDEANRRVVIVTVNEVPALQSAIDKGTITLKEVLEQSAKGSRAAHGALEETVVLNHGKWNSHACLEYTYTSKDFIGEDALAYHTGKGDYILDSP